MARIYSYISGFFFLVHSLVLSAQHGKVTGLVHHDSVPLQFVNIYMPKQHLGTVTDSTGRFTISNLPFGDYLMNVSILGFTFQQVTFTIHEKQPVVEMNISMKENSAELNEVVISGTLRETYKSESPVNVEVYTVKFFKSNPTASVFESLQNINGVRPQLNCNVCNTGDIHLNGMEGPYTMVLIDGMPIVSGLSTVYGLTGIPQSLIDRMEVIKGPSSTLYGSEAVGGIINIITKRPENVPLVGLDMFVTGWGELNADLGMKWKLGKKVHGFLGANYFNYQVPIDNNKDGFTDLTLQHRISLFNKWSVIRKDNRVFSVAFRYYHENRWGGQMNWTPEFAGTDSIYAETIQTNRWEAFGTYQFPCKENFQLQFSANGHYQRSFYGTTIFNADQYNAFGLFTWNKKLGLRNDFTIGLTYRFTYYDDNTPATALADTSEEINMPAITHLPGLFLQDEFRLNDHHTFLLGLRYDYHIVHGSIFSPRINYKWTSSNKWNSLRIGFGNGYRVANVFTEDHAALTGAREVVFLENLKPETSWNFNMNFVKRMYNTNGLVVGLDVSAWYTFFSNKIIPDYLTDPNKIIYANLSGFAQSAGGSINFDLSYHSLRLLLGATAMDVSAYNNHTWQRQLLTEQFSGTWTLSYAIKKIGLSMDYTGNLYGPMLLPLLGPLDNRPASSPWFSIQNIQLTLSLKNGIELFGGVKNFLNYTPPANSIARAFDPFDKGVVFDSNGMVVPTADNPNALTFDPSYVFASNQGIRGFIGIRYQFNPKPNRRK